MFIFAPESILMGFLKAFFGQEKLFGVSNEFQYIDNVEARKLNITMSDNFDEELQEALPKIVIQEGGFSENIQVIDNRNWHEPGGNNQAHRATFYHPVTIHCLAKYKGTAKLLQAATAKGIITFRKAIYEMGVDSISSLQGMPPQRLKGGDNSSGPYDCAVTFQMKMDQIWILSRTGDPEETVRVRMIAALENIEFDENGNIITPPELWFEQNILIDQGENNA